ncbi:MAG: hypothetical protein ABDH59_09575 [Fervidobacterium sp.]
MTLAEVANFISLVGFPIFMAYYVFTKYTEERKKACTYEELLKKFENLITRWEYTVGEQNKTICKLIEKIDKIIETNAIILDRLPRRVD